MDTQRQPIGKERIGEIAFIIVKDKMRREGIKLEHFRREIGNAAKRLGITVEEAAAFVEAAVRDIVNDTFSGKLADAEPGQE